MGYAYNTKSSRWEECTGRKDSGINLSKSICLICSMVRYTFKENKNSPCRLRVIVNDSVDDYEVIQTVPAGCPYACEHLVAENKL